MTILPNEPNGGLVFFEAKTSLSPIEAVAATVDLPKPIEVSPPQVEKSPTLINGETLKDINNNEALVNVKRALEENGHVNGAHEEVISYKKQKEANELSI